MLDEEAGVATDFNQRHRLATAEPVLEIERSVLGSDFAVTSYTTSAQITDLLSRLRFEPHHRILDVGTGAGWPALRVALETGCQLVGTDLPLAGLITARARAWSEGIAARTALALCTARSLPFRPYSFDAVLNADFFC